MAKKKVIIIGAGFAGINCALTLARAKKDIDIQILDRRSYSYFLPLLPDIIGRGFSPGLLTLDLNILNKKKIYFINKHADSVDIAQKKILAQGEIFPYDYAVICAGAQVNFYDNELIKRHAFKLYSAEDAVDILDAVRRPTTRTVAIIGGGYTGVELATSVKRYCMEHGINARVTIIEKGPYLLAGFDPKERDYTLANVNAMGIEARLNSEIGMFSDNVISLKNGNTFEGCVTIWAAGVKAASLEIIGAKVRRVAGDRIVVNDYLAIAPDCFCLGDMAAVHVKEGGWLVERAIYLELRLACARNIVNALDPSRCKRISLSIWLYRSDGMIGLRQAISAGKGLRRHYSCITVCVLCVLFPGVTLVS